MSAAVRLLQSLRRAGTLALLLVLAFLGGRWTACVPPAAGPAGDAAGTAAAVAAAPTVWTCSMHPQIRLPAAGLCPICNMDLIPLETGVDDDASEAPTLRLGPTAMALAGIQTARVERRSVERELRLVGLLDYDESRVAELAAWVPGRIERLFVDFTGTRVTQGDHMFEIYSPELYAAQRELLEALRTAERLGASPLELLRQTADATVVSVRQKLRLLGLSDAQVEEIVRRGSAEERLVVNAPAGGIVIHKGAFEGMYVSEGMTVYRIADLTRLWLQLDAYEEDLVWLRYGQEVEFEVAAWPGETFRGQVAFIDPVLDARTRTVKVRVHVANEDGRLRPDMFVRARVNAPLGVHGRVVPPAVAAKWMCSMHPEVLAGGPGPCPECGMDLVPATALGFVAAGPAEEPLVIPDTAPLVTGRRAVVYVRDPDAEQPTFHGREVVLGPRAGRWYVVRAGLEAGEEVVVEGAFKIDSELQLRGRPSMMNPPAGTVDPLAAPAAFRGQLGAAAVAAVSLQRGLAGDDLAAARAAAGELLERLGQVDMGLLRSQAHARWMELAPALLSSARAAAAAADLDGARAAFRDASLALVAALETFGFALPDGAATLGVFHCPMAFDDAGADWIGAGTTVANPYFGASMLRCGELLRPLREED